jgi:hypothetical protein
LDQNPQGKYLLRDLNDLNTGDMIPPDLQLSMGKPRFSNAREGLRIWRIWLMALILTERWGWVIQDGQPTENQMN